MPKPKLFISYRRTDAIDTVRALYFHMRLRFGISQIFMDVSAIVAGDVWPSRLKQALADASVVLVVIGPTWLTAADQYGRRRLDIEADWVRQEIETALGAGKTVIPLLIGGLSELPPPEALPTSLAALLDQQMHTLNDKRWEDDVKSLTNILEKTHGFKPADASVTQPDPEKANEPLLSEEELFVALKGLPRWEPVETFIPHDYPNARNELRRGLRFAKFKHAIAFLQVLVDPINQLKHHPRIENQWRTVFINFTTWDVGNRITAKDIEAAHLVDRLYQAFIVSVASSSQ